MLWLDFNSIQRHERVSAQSGSVKINVYINVLINVCVRACVRACACVFVFVCLVNSTTNTTYIRKLT